MTEQTSETYDPDQDPNSVTEDDTAGDEPVKVPNVHAYAVSGISHQALSSDDSRALEEQEPETADHATSGDVDADPDEVEVIPGETADHDAQPEAGPDGTDAQDGTQDDGEAIVEGGNIHGEGDTPLDSSGADTGQDAPVGEHRAE